MVKTCCSRAEFIKKMEHFHLSDIIQWVECTVGFALRFLILTVTRYCGIVVIEGLCCDPVYKMGQLNPAIIPPSGCPGMR